MAGGYRHRRQLYAVAADGCWYCYGTVGDPDISHERAVREFYPLWAHFMTTTYLGVINGMHTWEVRDESGNVVGKNQKEAQPCPGEGWTLDTATGEWVEPE